MKTAKKAGTNMTYEGIKVVDSSTAEIFNWLDKSIEFYHIYKEVKPLKDELDKMQKKAKELKDGLEKTIILLDQLEKDLKALEKDRCIKQERLDELTETAELMKNRLEAAQKLIKGLSSEEIRWGEEKVQLADNRTKLLGDCLICSAFLSYVGPFNQEFRRKMIFDDWVPDVLQRGLPATEKFNLNDLLTT